MPKSLRLLSIPIQISTIQGLPQEEPQTPKLDLAALIEQLKNSPELANTLADLIAGSKAC